MTEYEFKILRESLEEEISSLRIDTSLRTRSQRRSQEMITPKKVPKRCQSARKPISKSKINKRKSLQPQHRL